LEGDTGAFPAKTNVEFCQGVYYYWRDVVPLLFWIEFTTSTTSPPWQ
jgi:hypothetical protein